MMSPIRTNIRGLLPPILSRLPRFPGKGRITLVLDALLTDSANPASYLVVGVMDNGCRLRFDLRGWSQKFAFYYRDMEGDYVSAMRRLYRGGVFVDVGSSIGLYVVGLADLVREHGARVAAFEPVPFNRETQNVNVGLNGAEEIVDVFPFALGACEAVLAMQTDPRHADNNAFIATSGDVEVAVRRLDDVARGWPPIGLMKIDIEGFEPAMLEGARETIERDRPIIFSEFNRERMAINGFTMDETWRWFTERAFRFLVLQKRKLVPLDEPGSHENLFIVPAKDLAWAMEAVRT
jgi:FkbM family methyltransferase